MEDIAKAIEKLADKSIIDYLLVIVPIVVSIIAIVISITTASKQNKIALFERRYICLFQIKQILNFADTINGDINKNVILGLYDAFWGANILKLSGDKQIIEAKCHFGSIKKDVEQANFLFDYKFKVSPTDIIKKFHKVLFGSMGETDIENEKQDFISICDQFAKKDFKKLQKRMKL